MYQIGVRIHPFLAKFLQLEIRRDTDILAVALNWYLGKYFPQFQWDISPPSGVIIDSETSIPANSECVWNHWGDEDVSLNVAVAKKDFEILVAISQTKGEYLSRVAGEILTSFYLEVF